ncbi:helicase [Paenibacillus zeisoli]|uniref:Helicase n=1 Tax=Paenibacillus zeisoli TaxID=2496267 RepID=A0A433X572_9BACL|nr:HRDC domain-containing protein [Paenibacillus zeisoli]RUT29178.1 helicase [Paenibacillus zeisoli]
MRIIFLNSMEKKSGEQMPSGAQVWIGEDEGVWRMGWNELTADEEDETVWYEGESWSELLHVYRHRLAVKLGEGFRPVIDGIFHEREEGKGKAALAQKLVFYSELNPNEALFTELSAWRRRRAAAERKAPYLIASNRLLRLISVFQPRTRDELLQLPGVGESKSAEYGDELLELTQQGERSFIFPLNWVEGTLVEEDFRSWLYKQKEVKYRVEMEKFGLRRVMLEAIAEGSDVEEMCRRTGLDRRETVELLEDLEKEGYELEPLLLAELKEVPEAEQTAIWQAYEELGDTFLKPVLQRVYGAELPAESNVEKMYEQLRLIRIRYRRQGPGVRSAG